MSNTVPSLVKLAAAPKQPTARDRETLPAIKPKTWTFIDSNTSELRPVTCLPGCVVDHRLDRETPTHPDDIQCRTAGSDVFLPMVSGGIDGLEEVRVMDAFIRREPFSKNLHERVPHAQVEIVEDHWIEALDPDGLATVILALESQLARFREVHAQLVELRAQGRVQL
ncbi:DUF6907 domain-containing protein [Streptomyces globosus]|uniref:DUF6907 domain-containing protein n=1 Tax=Streptomyces globosus TaxID=68209 RepID=UPI0031CE512E